MTLNPWTKQELTDLHAGHHAGLSYDELATQFGRTAKAVEVKLYRSRPLLPKPKREKVTHEARIRRLARVITRIDTPVIGTYQLGDTFTHAGRTLTYINTNPEGDVVCVDRSAGVAVVVIAGGKA